MNKKKNVIDRKIKKKCDTYLWEKKKAKRNDEGALYRVEGVYREANIERGVEESPGVITGFPVRRPDTRKSRFPLEYIKLELVWRERNRKSEY